MKKILAMVFIFTLVIGFNTTSVLSSNTFETTPYETEDGKTVFLTTDAASKLELQVNNHINEVLDKAVTKGNVDELKTFQLKKEISDLLSQINATDTKSKDAKVDIVSSMNSIKHIIVSDWRQHSPELRQVMRDVEVLTYLKGNYDSCNGLSNEMLKKKLHSFVVNHKNLGYKGARQVFFSKLDNVNGYVECVYTGRKVKTNSTPNAGGSTSMNCEHTWPKSKGAKAEPAKADIFHLYPTDTQTNSRRSSHPFGNVTNASWTSEGGSLLGGSTFMPRACHRGNVARSMFYFSIRYNMKLDSKQEKALREWHKADPVDAREKARNEGICEYQGNRNPFIDRPDFVDQISDF